MILSILLGMVDQCNCTLQKSELETGSYYRDLHCVSYTPRTLRRVSFFSFFCISKKTTKNERRTKPSIIQGKALKGIYCWVIKCASIRLWFVVSSSFDEQNLELDLDRFVV